MNVLRDYLPRNYCTLAAKEILSWERGVIGIATGFYVAGHAETDGPAGTVTLAKALGKLGFDPVIITDEFCENFFELEELKVRYMSLQADEDYCRSFLEDLNPVGMISIERCGKNRGNRYANMKGIDIGDHTAPIDRLFSLAYGNVPTIGIGDGGNEIGMGNLAGIISRKLSLTPCEVRTDLLVIASVSNWGAYALAEMLGELTRICLLPSSDEIEEYIEKTVNIGSVDGVTHKQLVSVDGNDISIEKEIIDDLRRRYEKIENVGIL